MSSLRFSLLRMGRREVSCPKAQNQTVGHPGLQPKQKPGPFRPVFTPFSSRCLTPSFSRPLCPQHALSSSGFPTWDPEAPRLWTFLPQAVLPTCGHLGHRVNGSEVPSCPCVLLCMLGNPSEESALSQPPGQRGMM